LSYNRNDNLSDKTKSLNQSGAFLQIYVQNELTKYEWNTSMEVPLRVSPFLTDPWKKEETLQFFTFDYDRIDPVLFVKSAKNSLDRNIIDETSIDVIGQKAIGTDYHFNLCIEAKKLNPNYSDWVFFQKHTKLNEMNFVCRQPINPTKITLFKIPKITPLTAESHLIISNMTDYFQYPVCNFGLALAKNKIDKQYYKSEKTIVDEAARQIIKGTFGYIINKIFDQILNGFPERYPYDTFDCFMPIVVTTAKLFLCNYDVNDIDSDTGKITKDPSYKQVDSLIYQCAAPTSVQFPSTLENNDSIRQILLTSKWDVLVLSPKGLTKFLKSFKS